MVYGDFSGLLRKLIIEGGDCVVLGEGNNPIFWMPLPDGAIFQGHGEETGQEGLAFAMHHRDFPDWEEEVKIETSATPFHLSDTAFYGNAFTPVSSCTLYLMPSQSLTAFS